MESANIQRTFRDVGKELPICINIISRQQPWSTFRQLDGPAHNGEGMHVLKFYYIGSVSTSDAHQQARSQNTTHPNPRFLPQIIYPIAVSSSTWIVGILFHLFVVDGTYFPHREVFFCLRNEAGQPPGYRSQSRTSKGTFTWWHTSDSWACDCRSTGWRNRPWCWRPASWRTCQCAPWCQTCNSLGSSCSWLEGSGRATTIEYRV